MPNIEDLLLPHIYRLKTYQGVAPSETLAEQAGIPLERVIRLNGNENPYGPSPRVAEALGNYRDYNHYPDPAQRNLRAALSDYLGVPDDNIVAGNGSDEIIDLLMRMFLAPDDEIIIPVPTFGMYSFSADVAGANAVSVPPGMRTLISTSRPSNWLLPPAPRQSSSPVPTIQPATWLPRPRRVLC